MKKILYFILILLLIVSATMSNLYIIAAAEGPEIKSAAAILIDYKTGHTLFEKNADNKAYPASTTKIMTGILAIENLDPETVITASATAIDIDRDGSNIGILLDEQLTADELIYALLVHSANDAANVLAETISGTIGDFVTLMNSKAIELGMTNTHFTNAHGYHDDNHYTTARDLSRLCAYAMKNEKFAAVVSTPNLDLPPTEKYPHVRHLSSNNMLINPLKGQKYLYKGAKGIKTGHTEKAGYCLASFAQKDKLSFICVTMASPIDEKDNHSFKDTIALFDYGFNNFKVKTLPSTNEIVTTADVKWAKGGERAILTVDTPIEALLPSVYDPSDLTTTITLYDKIKAPVAKGDVLGTMEYFYKGESAGVVNLVVKSDVKRSYLRMISTTVLDAVKIPFFILTAIYIILRTIKARKKRKMRRMRRQQLRDKY